MHPLIRIVSCHANENKSHLPACQYALPGDLQSRGHCAGAKRSLIYAVRIAGLLSEADGVAVAAKLRIQLRLQDVSVSLN